MPAGAALDGRVAEPVTGIGPGFPSRSGGAEFASALEEKFTIDTCRDHFKRTQLAWSRLLTILGVASFRSAKVLQSSGVIARDCMK